MSLWILIPIALAMGITLCILIVGIIAMACGGEVNRRFSNTLMIARVSAQGLVILLILLMVLIR